MHLHLLKYILLCFRVESVGDVLETLADGASAVPLRCHCALSLVFLVVIFIFIFLVVPFIFILSAITTFNLISEFLNLIADGLELGGKAFFQFCKAFRSAFERLVDIRFRHTCGSGRSLASATPAARCW